MEPVLQRFGDVTIQRLEKPKTQQQHQPNDIVEVGSGKEENVVNDGNSTLKRSYPDSQISIKRLKTNQMIHDVNNSGDMRKIIDKNDGFSDSELSDFDSDTDIESDIDINIGDNNGKNLMKMNGDDDDDVVDDDDDVDEDNDDDVDVEDESTNTTFLDKIVDEPSYQQNENQSDLHTNKSQENLDTDTDYDFDIKEKLKEMGEISFQTVKKGEKPKKVEVTENEVVVTPARKPGTTEDENSGERKGLNLRRNIREVMDETKLDESTLAAQRQEMERLQRVQEQQRLLRELQRQAAQERMQHKVISLLQGNNFPKPGTSSTRIGNTVLMKLPNGQSKPMAARLPKRPFDLVRLQKNIGMNVQQQQQQQRNMNNRFIPPPRPGTNLTPSVSIAPVTKKLPPPVTKIQSDSDSEEEEGIKSPIIKPKEPVTTIDISSDEDCIVVSEGEDDDDDDVGDTEDDPSNSGMHTNDEFNQPDEQGRVIINVGHPDNEPDLFVAPQIARIIKPHQIGGVRFLYDNVVESTSRFDSSTGFGCILAHSMGLGKTLQIVCFSDIFLRHTSAKTILCIMPINTLQNWCAEFNMWLPTEDAVGASPLIAHGEVRPRNFNLHVLNDSHKTLAARARVIKSWRNDGGVLLIGYEQFRLLSLRKHPKTRKKTVPSETVDDDKNKALFDDVHEALVKPGPDLVICDEGHRIKNSHASISQALKLMRTKRRIVLTGYPLQNNLMEYWCMVDFVRPNYLGSKTEFCNMFERPIMNGQCIDSTESDIKLMRYRAHVLHSLLVGFVQRRSHAVLQCVLPQKEEYVLLVRMSQFQRKLYETFMDEVVRSQAVPNPLKAFAVCCKIWNHPDVLYNFLKKRARGDAVDIDLEEVAGTTTGNNLSNDSNGGKPKKTPARARRGARGGKKPAASITPYSTTTPEQQQNSSQSESTTNSFNIAPPQLQQQQSVPQQQQLQQQSQQQQQQRNEPFMNQNFQQQNSQFFQQPNHFPQNFQNNSTNFNNFNPKNNFINFQRENVTNFSQPNFINNISDNSQFPPPNQNNYGNFDQNNSYHQQQQQNFQQNFWGQPPHSTQQQQPHSNEYYNCNPPPQYNPEFFNNNSNQSWIKKEESVLSPIKSENSNDSKPKINIISDIKLPSVFNSNNNNNTNDKKIQILSDIKIEPKIEEIDDKNDIKLEIKDENRKDEIDDDVKLIETSPTIMKTKDTKEDTGIPYDWAIELLKDYVPGCIENSAKMEILFCIISESIALGDRLLVFSQSLITLDLIEQFLQMNLVPGDVIKWQKNISYYRLDGSTSALEREKLINEFNSNPKIHLFLVSTRAGSLGINLIGANRVVVLDASWNPCHDTQAVCRVYRYGQRKPCFVYRLVVDNCLEKKIYDRQINKQGMSDRVVDECNPDAHLTMKDVNTLCWDDKVEEDKEKDWSHVRDNYIDVVLQKVIEKHGRRLNKEPFQHESLLVDRKEKQLSQQEKRLAKKGYEREKQAARQPTYNMMAMGRGGHRPVASVRPMQQGTDNRSSRWIPAEHWQRQGMTAQEMTLPLDVVIPTNQPEKGNIVLKAGQKVLVLKSPKGVYMQLESGKIVAIKTAIKVKGKAEDNHPDPTKLIKQPNLPPTTLSQMNISSSITTTTTTPTTNTTQTGMRFNNPSLPVMPQKRIVKPFQPGITKMNVRSIRQTVPNLVTRMPSNIPPKNIKERPFTMGSSGNIDDQQKDSETIPGSSSDEEHTQDRNKFNTNLNKNKCDNNVNEKRLQVQKTSSIRQQNQSESKHQSVLQKLEQTTTSMMNDSRPFQETLDSITNSYKDDGLEDDTSVTSSNDNKPTQSDTSDHSDEVTYVSEQPPSQAAPAPPPPPPVAVSSQSSQPYPPPPPSSTPQSSVTPQQSEQIKTEIPTDYTYSNYYNYSMQPYHVPPPPATTPTTAPPPHIPQNYGYPHQPPPPYDLMGYPPQSAQQPPPHPPPQYTYGYPQGYPPPPPQPHYPPPPPPNQTGYDYNTAPPPPPPPLYGGYQHPYPPPQQYPPPPPTQGMYPGPPAGNPPGAPPPPPPVYPDYQYPQSQPTTYYANT